MPHHRLRQIYALVGEATTVWNQVEELWYLIFTGLMAETPREITDAIYGFMRTGAMQRQLLMKVAPLALEYDVKATEKGDKTESQKRDLQRHIRQLHARTEKLVTARNAVAHTSFEIGLSIPLSIAAISPHSRSPLAGKDHLMELQRLIEDSTLLLLDLADLRDDLIDIKDPGSIARHEAILRSVGGFIINTDERKKERARLLEAVARRASPHSQPSAR